MKIVFSNDAAHEYRTIQMLADKDTKAYELLFRLSAVLADMIQKPGINDSEIGKTVHYPNVEEGYLGGELKGCIARNLDASNRLVACEINGVAVILSCLVHYNNPILNPDELSDLRYDLVERIKVKPEILSDMESASQDIIEAVHVIADGTLKSAADRKSIYNMEDDIFSINISKIEGMVKNKGVVNAMKLLPGILANLVNYSTFGAIEESGGDLHRLLGNKQNYDRLINTFVIDLIQEVSSIQKGRETDEYMAHKELLIKGILDGYADAYRNCLKFPVEPELYREDWDFINRLNEKMVYGGSNGLTDLFSGSGAHHGVDRGEKHQASDPEEERIRKGGAHFVRITRVLGRGPDVPDSQHFTEFLEKIDVHRLTDEEAEDKRQTAKEERERQQSEEQQQTEEKRLTKEDEKIQKRQEKIAEKRREQESGRDGCTREEVNADIGKGVTQTAQHPDDSRSAEGSYGEINNLAARNIDTDRFFVKSVYKKQLDDLKVGHKVAYYIPEKNVVEFTENWSDCHEEAPDANDVLKVWGSTVETAEDDIIPDGAVEVCFNDPLADYINPEYRAQDLGRAIALASAIYQEKSLAEVRADLPVSVFTFADEESWDRCQAMIERVISRNRKPPAGRNEDPPVR